MQMNLRELAGYSLPVSTCIRWAEKPPLEAHIECLFLFVPHLLDLTAANPYA